jgi:hypothetical protein
MVMVEVSGRTGEADGALTTLSGEDGCHLLGRDAIPVLPVISTGAAVIPYSGLLALLVMADFAIEGEPITGIPVSRKVA